METFNDINLNNCYSILSSTPEEDIAEIRKKFFYKLSYLEVYWFYIGETYLGKKENVDVYIKDLRDNEAWIKLVCDAYLAILLYQIDKESYHSIIVGLCNGINSYIEMEKIQPSILDKELKANREDVRMTNYKYLYTLNYHNNAINDEANITGSLDLIIEFEKLITSPCELIDCYVYAEEPTYQENFFSLLKEM